ncbi:unnamed protein product [Prunus brigantina]
MVTPQEKSSKKMKFVSSSAETEPTSTTTISEDSKSGRGMSTMPRVVKRKLQKIKPIVEYNKRGEGIGQAHSEMQSYIGVLARFRVPLVDKKWAEIPKDIKEQIWEAVDMAFVDELQKQVSEGKVSVSGSNDVLTMALGPEHPGRVRGPSLGLADCESKEGNRLFSGSSARKSDHLYFNGVDQSYKNWTFHGEPWEATTNASRNVEEDDGHSRYSFVSEEIDMDDNDFGDFGSDPYEFANVIGDGDQPVYPGCRKYTKLSALVKLYHLKAKHGMSEVSKSLTWHAARKSIDGQMSHPADSPSWKLLDDKWPKFGNEPRNLRLALSSDGFNPHSSLSSRYSCWPVILVTYNLPPWLCMKQKFMMLTLLISGPKQPGNDIDVYLEPLIDDLKSLWDEIRGVYDAHNEEYFTLRAALMWTINDFPAYGNLSGCVVKGYKVCPICGDDTPSHRVCWKKKSIFFDLEYWKYLPVRHVLDVMHIEKNVCDSIIGTLLEIPGKIKDGIVARLDLLNMGVKTDLQPEYGERRTRLPPGPWNLSRAEKREVCNSFYGMKNRTRPEGCIAERYIAEEAVEFCTEHLSDVSTVGVPSSQKMGVSKPLSGCTVSVVDQDLLNQAHLYVLENTEEVLPYIEQHMIHIKTAYPKFRKRTKWLQDKHNSTFIQWLRFKVYVIE